MPAARWATLPEASTETHGPNHHQPTIDMRRHLLSVALLANSAFAAGEIHVPGDFSTIQAAIDASADGDVVVVADGTYTGVGNRDIDFRGKRIRLESENGPAVTVIDAEGDAANARRALLFISGEGPETVVSGFTLLGGYDDTLGGGSALCQDSSPTFLRCEFKTNEAQFGGAVLCKNADPVFRWCSFVANHGDFGGAVAGDDSSLSLDECTFEANTAHRGGAVYLKGSVSVTPRIANSTFHRNIAEAAGGAIHIWSSSAIVRHSGFRGNIAGVADGSGGTGGAIACLETSTMLQENTFEANVAQGTLARGGALVCEESEAILRENLFSKNRATANPTLYDGDTRGGALHISGSTVPVIGGSPGAGNTFRDNRAIEGNAIYYDLGDSIVDARYNTLEISPVSSYFVAPLRKFDLSESVGLHAAIEHDVVISPTGSDREEGTGPLRTVQFALSRMRSTPGNPLVIGLEPGVYSPSATGEVFPLTLMSHLSLVGDGCDSTVLDAEGSGRVLHCQGIQGVEVSGLEIRGGSSWAGGGLYCHSSSIALTRNLITMNEAMQGGGISLRESSNSVVSDNVIAHNTFLTHPIFSSEGGGVQCVDSSPVLEGNLIASNASKFGGALACFLSSDPILSGNTLTQNTADFGGAIWAGFGSRPTVVNGILWQNLAGTNPEISEFDGSSIVTVSYSDVLGGWPGTGNLDVDPLFVDPLNEDFHLQSGSPCIDAGDPASALDCDGSLADMGALSAADCGQPIGVNYCTATVNSSGQSASIHATGSEALADNSVTLVTTDMPANQVGFYLMSKTQGFVPLFNGSAGNLCLSGQILRLQGPQPMHADSCGVMSFSLDTTDLPGNTVFQPGETWNFQLWFRDIVGGNSTTNTSDGVAITWQ